MDVYLLLNVVHLSGRSLVGLIIPPEEACRVLSLSLIVKPRIFLGLCSTIVGHGEKSLRGALREKLTGPQLIRILWNPKVRYTTNQITRGLQTFLNKCLRRIMDIKWTGKITNEELWTITKQKPIEIQIKRRNWNWIGHTLRKEAGPIEKTVLDWNLQGYRRRGGPKRTWRSTIEDEIRNTGRSRNEVKGMIAGDRNTWKLFVDALCSTRSKRK
jgi:hypothetical protein